MNPSKEGKPKHQGGGSVARILHGAFEVVDSPLAILWTVIPAQKVASSNVAESIHGNPDDASRWVGPRIVAIQPDIACRAASPVACVHKRSSRLMIYEPLHGQPPHTSGPKCTCSRNRLFVQNKKNDIFGICEIVKSIIIKISGDFNSTRNILKHPSCMCRNELRCQTPPLSKMSGSSCRCGVDWTRPKNDGLPKAFSRLSSPFRLSG